MLRVEERQLVFPSQVFIDGIPFSVAGVQLIGVAAHPEPVVYLPLLTNMIATHKSSVALAKLPSMEKLVKYPTRPLSDFEQKTLKELSAGKVTTVLGDWKIVGAIRGEASCVKCHEVKEGEMLGAFSYSLVRSQQAE